MLANGFFVAAEFALAKVRPSALETLAASGDEQAIRAHKLIGELERLLPATQLGITLASLGLGWIGEPAVADHIGPLLAPFKFTAGTIHGISLTVAFVIITLFHIVLGELVPKSLALNYPVQLARWTARPIEVFFLITYPALYVLDSSSGLVLRSLGLQKPAHDEQALSIDELRILVQASVEGRGLASAQRELIERVLRTTDKPVRSIMVPRVDMATLSLDDAFERSLSIVRRTGYSRYPVSEDGNPDKIAGYIYVKDLIMTPVPPQGIRSLKRDILFVPETTKVAQVLGEFQKSKIPIAVIVDEYGGTSGIVTMEDVIEEIVGEIQDELDREPEKIRVRDDGTIVIEGSMPVSEITLEGFQAEPLEGGDTLGGYIVAALGRLVEHGDTIDLGQYRVTVEQVRRRRVSRLALRKLPPKSESLRPNA